jgi:trimethylamine--corrinoid protein Co-methyltransferase
MAQTGATAPGTLAGTLAQENAEILAGICLVERIRPGVPVCYGGIPHVFDMRTTQLVFAGPEQALMAVAMTELGKSYGLPVYVNVGLTDSKIPDAQAGLEAGVTLACGALAGADIFGHFGICGVDQAASLAMLLMQHEAIGYVERLLGDLEVSEETLGLEALGRARNAGSFLADEHTVRHFRRELWFPQLLDRRFFQSWLDDGKKDMALRCREMKDRILREHAPVPLDDGLSKAIDKLLEDARRHLAP